MRFFVLGTHPSLSLAELAAVLEQDLDFSQTSADICLLDTQEEPDVLQTRCAGVVKIGSVIAEVPINRLDEAVELIASLLANTAASRRLAFGFSYYLLKKSKPQNTVASSLRELGMKVKRTLEGSGLPSRFVTARDRALSAVVVETNHLLENGGEFVFIENGERVLIGQTQSVQDFAAWSERDYGRPKRNAKAGMLPPKLARMMINLSGTSPETTTLLDPFCGSGTVLMEAALIGFSRLIGSDIAPRAIKDTRANLAWLKEQMGMEMPPVELTEAPAAKLPGLIHEPVEAIVTETFLGPPAKKEPSAEEISALMRSLASLYESSFLALKQVTQKKACAVVAFPVFFRGHKPLHLPLAKRLSAAGWRIESPLPKSVPESLRRLTPNNGLLYHRADQFVGREILVLKSEV